MVAFIVALLIIVALICTVLLCKIGVRLSFEDEFSFSVTVFSFPVFKSKTSKKKSVKKSKKSPKKEEMKEKKEKKENFVKVLIKKKGFVNAVRELSAFLGALLKRFSKLLKHFFFEKILLDINVAEDNAADTAIKYGEVCTIVYPTAQLLNSLMNTEFKAINIRSDFTSNKSDLKFDFRITVRVIYLLIFAFGLYKEYRNFMLRNDLNERK